MMGSTASKDQSKEENKSNEQRQSEVVQKQSKPSEDDDNNLALAFVPSFLHNFITQNLCNLTKCPAVVEEASSVCPPSTSTAFIGACVLTDISGLTKVSSKFCKPGHSGLDDLLTKTNSIFEQYVQIVYAHGGDGKCVRFKQTV